MPKHLFEKKMNLSVEISLYPLNDGYLPIIESFLTLLDNNNSGVEIRVTNMSTRLFGGFDAVTDLLNTVIKESMQKYGKMVFVCKYLEGDARTLEGFT